MMVFGLRALHPPHPLRLQQLHRLSASWHLPRPCAHHCLSCRAWRCRSLVRLLADIPRQAGLPPQSDRAYASSSSCDGTRACACAPKASAADARVRAENRAAARFRSRGTGSGLPAARGSCNQRPVHVPRTPPVAVTAGAGLRADAANGPVGNIRVPNTWAGVEGATAGAPVPCPRTPVCDWRRPRSGCRGAGSATRRPR